MIDVLVLAGGKSRRMGTDKARLSIDGQQLIATVASAVAHLGQVHIVGGAPSLCNAAVSAGLPQPPVHIPDHDSDVGPFGAVVNALDAVTSSEILVVSCDLPMLTARDVNLLVSARRRADADLAVPLVGGERQWHIMCFAQRVAPQLATAYRNGVRSLRRGFSGLSQSTLVVNNPGFGFDLDTPEDLERLKSWAPHDDVTGPER